MKSSVRDVLVAMAAVLSVALAARVSLPVSGSPVPQSLHTLAVVLVGAWLDPGRGALALAFYLAVGVAKFLAAALLWVAILWARSVESDVNPEFLGGQS